MVLILLLAARLVSAANAEPIVHASVSMGPQFVLGTNGALRSGPVARTELGAGFEMLQGYAVLQSSMHNGLDPYSQLDAGRLVTVGDLRVTDFGVGARLPVPLGPVWLSPHVDLGLQSCDSPMDTEFYQSDLLPSLGQSPAVGPHELGGWAQGGADFGVDLQEDEVGVFLGADAGMSSTGLGLVIAARLGAEGRF